MRSNVHSNIFGQNWNYFIIGLSILFIVLILQTLGQTVQILFTSLCLAIVCIPFATWLLPIFLTLLLGIPVVMSEMPIQIMGIRVYGADFVIYLMGISFLYLVFVPETREQIFGKKAQQEIRILCWLMLIMFLYGFVPLIRGFIAGHETNNIFGDFRRLYFYPLAMFVPLILPLRKRHLQLLPFVLFTGGLLAMAMGTYRLVTGTSWSHEYFLLSDTPWTQQARLLSQFEIATLGLFLGFMTCRIFTASSKFSKFIVFVLIVLTIYFLMISGWRLAFIYILICPLVPLTFIMINRKVLLFNVIFKIILTVTIAGSSIYFFASNVLINTFNTMITRTQEKRLEQDQRYHAWHHAYLLFLDKPVLGVGIGHDLSFYQMTDQGDFIYTHATSHNMYVDIAYKAGLIGIMLYIILLYYFSSFFVTHFKKFPITNYSSVYLGFFGGFVAILIVNFLQPIQTGALVALYIIMGYLLLNCIKMPSCNYDR